MWQQCELVDARPSIGVTVPEKLHYFMISHEKLAKIKNRRSSRRKELNCLRRDDRRFASWRIIIADIQRGKIAGLGGGKQSWPKSPYSVLDSLLFSSPTL